MKIAVLCPSEIALRRFMPALQANGAFEFGGIGVASPAEWFGEKLNEISTSVADEQIRKEAQKAKAFTDQFGGKQYQSYEDLIHAPELDAVYIPLPPGLHHHWASAALKAGKHVFVEKPATTSLSDSLNLVETAAGKLALHENYMFVFHRQLDAIEEILASGEIGEIRLIRISFGFPRRAANDFRYNKALGGGALLDCGGYTIRYATRLLGDSARLVTAQANAVSGFDVDVFGSATMVNDQSITAQLAFGLDNNYKCDLEVWGSKGTLFTGRVLTAPAGFTPKVEIRKGNETETRDLPADDAFSKSIEHFKACICDPDTRKKQYAAILKQAEFIDQFKQMTGL
jgi:hypothetical protein